MNSPEQSSIQQNDDNIIQGIWPYIKRLKTDNIEILIVGIEKGDTAARLLELDNDKKINKIYGIDTDKKYVDDLAENVKKNNRIKLIYNNEPVNVVIVYSHTDLNETLKKYYNKVKHNGIFCGDKHGASEVSSVLKKFRRESKIGTPINVSKDCWFWYVR